MGNSRTIQKKPNLFVYFFAGGLLLLLSKIIWRLKFRGTKPKGPAIVISNHTSNIDWIVEGCMTWPKRMTFLVTYHFFTFRFIGFLLEKLVRAIPKYQFSTDLASIRKMKSVLHDCHGLLYIAPEGTVWGNGKLGYIMPSICKMLKMMKVPVYSSRIRGAGLGCAKWSARLHRTKILTETSLLFTTEDLQSLSIEQMHSEIVNALDYNEFDFQKEFNLKNRSRNKAEGFETLFFICPSCRNEFTLETQNNTIRCNCCKTEAYIGDDFRFTWNTEQQFFDNYTQWYDWQLGQLKEKVAEPDFRFSEEVDYGTDFPGKNYIKVGHGTMTLSQEGWDYNGTFNNTEVHEHDDLRQVTLATLKKGLHFELPYRFNHCRVFYPANGLHAAKWHLLSRAITELLAEKK